MKAVVLCGGLGTRLREETEYRPKPMVEIGGRPILWHIMKMYAHHGFREFVLCLGYRGNMIKEYFLNYEAMNNDFTMCLGRQSQIRYHGNHGEQGFAVTLADTGLNTMTGGRVKRIQRYVQGEPFMLTYGDGVTDLDLTRLLEFHQAHGKLATVTAVTPTSRFGILEMNGSGQGERSFLKSPRLRPSPAPVFLSSSRGYSIILKATDASWSANRWSVWRLTGNSRPTCMKDFSIRWTPTANTSI